ncbi:MAG: preprotein translocase subunit SecA [Candidatus Margulisiibacteriota bacterium]
MVISIIESIKGIFVGDPAKKTTDRYQVRVNQINELEPQFSELSDTELAKKTIVFRQQLKNGIPLNDILPEAFAVVREAAKRTLKMRHFDVQLIGGMVLHECRIAEMKTGEGKTLVATLPAYLNALEEKGVHLVTVNDYLAKRDAEWMGQIYRFLGLTVGLIQNDMPHDERKAAYACDITFGTNNEYGFDYLRDNLASSLEECVQRSPHYAIIDEVDSILIDEARTPLIISGSVEDSTAKYKQLIQVAKKLKFNTDFSIDEKHKNVVLTEDGTKTIESMLGIPNIYSIETMDIAHIMIQSLKALHLFKRDIDYVIKEGQVMIVDEFTGRVLEGRRYSDGLHQAIEASENLVIQNESQTLASVTYQNYFRLFPKLSGMTGTAKTEEEEFVKIYGLDVAVIPTNKPIQREDTADVIYKTKNEKYKAIVNDIKVHYNQKQPVLVGTIAIETSELISNLLVKEKIPHQVLNAKFHEKEAEIVKNAGQAGSITIATNMAGRGTDIVLGEGVVNNGGLYVIGSERHESRRIDNQLRGRSGRQGDPGKSKFYTSLEDDLMRLFGSERIASVMNTLGLPDDTPIEHNMITRSLSKAQKKVEQFHFSARKQILEFDNVLDKQRETVYTLRRQCLREGTILEKLTGGITDVMSYLTLAYNDPLKNRSTAKENHDVFCKTILDIFPYPAIANELKINDKLTKSELTSALINEFKQQISHFPSDIFSTISRLTLLRHLDGKWMDQLHNMDALREGIGLRAYGQRDPLVEYKVEAFQMFKEMIFSVYSETVKVLNRIESIETTAPQTVEGQSPKTMRYSRSQSTMSLKSSSDALGRNDKVTIEKDGQTKELKWKKAKELVESQGWKVINV